MLHKDNALDWHMMSKCVDAHVEAEAVDARQ